MSPTEFKSKWIQDESDRWTKFNFSEVEKSDLNQLTKDFLALGFPEDAAPYLGFGLRSYDWKFNTILGYYEYDDLNPATEFYWILGSDNSGNPICIDSSQNDRIILLDHEQDFEIIQTVNKNITELASSLIIFRDFTADSNSEITEEKLMSLEEKFITLNPNHHIESSFWDTEIENLRSEIK